MHDKTPARIRHHAVTGSECGPAVFADTRIYP